MSYPNEGGCDRPIPALFKSISILLCDSLQADFCLTFIEKLVSYFCEQERRHNLVAKSHCFSSIRAVMSPHGDLRDHGKPT